ncbi:Hsp70 family protein [Aestuariispira ectoiniformans]|uniref:Hsp70 family protein n=1 Tax=Aestuariispira ectoiniformans TaxID=2775080 RepID=UPI00223B5DB5|nr:Hsp70 family protein [Aestuariispira ectoiniformans]
MYCGLDFGTSNSALGVVDNAGKVRLCPLEEGRETMPSALFYYTDDARVTYGRQAVQDYLEGEDGRLMRSIKSVLGTSLMDEATRIGSRNYPFKSVIGDYLARVKATAEALTEKKLTHVVHGRPVNFVDGDEAANLRAETALREIALDVGFKEITFLPEPVAAANDFVNETKNSCLALVVDMGGGTSDFTLLQVNPQADGLADYEVLANYGVRLGGTNLDQQLSLAKVMPLFGSGAPLQRAGLDAPNWVYSMLSSWPEINFLYSAKYRQDLKWVIENGADEALFERLQTVIEEQLGHRVAHHVELAKIALGDQEVVDVDLGYVETGLVGQVLQAEIATDLAQSFDRLDEALSETLTRGTCKADQVGVVVLTGGTTGMPAIRARIQERFPDATLMDQDAFGSVCTGLTLEARKTFGS